MDRVHDPVKPLDKSVSDLVQGDGQSSCRIASDPTWQGGGTGGHPEFRPSAEHVL